MNKYSVELFERLKKEFRKLDKYTQKIIRAWIDKNLVHNVDTRLHVKGVKGKQKRTMEI